ncbi:hypothetical protein GQ457_08G036780 [Hibiscus cannabinus]
MTLAKFYQAHIHCQYVTKLFPSLTKSPSLQFPPSAAAAAAAVVNLESANEPAALPVEDLQYNLAMQKQIIAFCLGSSLEIAILYAGTDPPRQLPLTFNLLSIAIMLAFTCISVGKCFMNSKFDMIARKLEQLGGIFTVAAFFIATAIPFPWWLQCCTGFFFLSTVACNLFSLG